MLIEEKIYYIDVEQLCLRNRAISISVMDDLAKSQQIIYAGKTILSMPVTDKEEKVYQVLEDEYNVRFIFDDAIPQLQFYPVPQLGIFAIDSFGGCFGSTNTAVDISEENAPIYYIDNDIKCYYLVSNMLEFIQLTVFQPTWRSRLGIDGFSVVEPSLGGKEYLINTLDLNRNATAIDTTKITKSNISVYPSFEEAKKAISFYDIKSALARLEERIVSE